MIIRDPAIPEIVLKIADHYNTNIATRFFGTGIPTIIMVLRQKRKNTDVLIVDASKGFEKDGKNNKLRASDIKKIVDTVIAREDSYKFSKVVNRDEIRSNEYNLNIPRYVDSSETAESWDIYASMFGGIPERELNELNHFWSAFPELQKALFKKNAGGYASVKVKDIKAAITEHGDVKAFIKEYNSSFASFEKLLTKELITNMLTVIIPREENVLSKEIFKRLNDVPLIDKYEAYQLLDDNWTKIAIDLEIIQTEGFEATRKVDPNMVTKKKDNKDIEVQDGWKGHVLPFDLVQETYLSHEQKKLKDKENRLVEISSELEELLDSFSEEEKEGDTVNEAKDSFVNTVVAKEAKQYQAEQKKNGAYPEDSYEARILKVDTLITEEKVLKKQVKGEKDLFHLKTKAVIEKLSDEQVYELLKLKWVSPLVSSLNQLTTDLVHDLTSKVQALAEKYATTYKHLEEEILETEKELASMIDELTGNEFDMKGLSEFKSFLMVKDNE
jgi:type I restriction enzyme M protein